MQLEIFPEVSNSEASPIPELVMDDTNFDRQWVRLGSLGPKTFVSPSTKVEIVNISIRGFTGT